MLTQAAAELLRSRNPVASNILPDPEQFLHVAALRNGARILFVPLRSEGEFESFVHTSALNCLARSYEITKDKKGGLAFEREKFQEEILRLSQDFPSPIIEGGRQFVISGIIAGAPKPKWLLSPTSTVAGREISYDLTQLCSFLRSRPGSNSGLLAGQMTRVEEIKELWQGYKKQVGDIEHLNKTAAVPASVKDLATMGQGGLNAGVLVFTPKSPFKERFRALVEARGTLGQVTVAEITSSADTSENKQDLYSVVAGATAQPLVVVHPPSRYMAQWVQELRDPASVSFSPPGALRHVDTVIIDLTKLPLSSENEAVIQQQAELFKAALVSGVLRNVVCLVRLESMAAVSRMATRWSSSGSPDVPVNIWQVSRQQACRLASPPVDYSTGHLTVQVCDEAFRSLKQQFRLVLDRLDTTIHQLPGLGQLDVLAAFRELFFRFISYFDPTAFEADSRAFLEQLTVLHRLIGGGPYQSLRADVTEVLGAAVTTFPGNVHPLVASAGQALNNCAVSGRDNFRLSVLSYNNNPQDRAYLAGYLGKAAGRTVWRSLRVEFADPWNMPPVSAEAPSGNRMLLCFNLPGGGVKWGFAASLFFNRYARHCVILCDQSALYTYHRVYAAIKGLYEGALTDQAMAEVLGLPIGSSPVLCDGKAALDYDIPPPPRVETADAPSAGNGELIEVKEDYDTETVISRLVNEKLEANERHRQVNGTANSNKLVLILDRDGALEVGTASRFYRIDRSHQDSSVSSVPASDLRPGDDIIQFRKNSRLNLNELIDSSLSEVEPYRSALVTSNRWREAVRKIDGERRELLPLADVFGRVGFYRDPVTFANYLNGTTTRPQDLPHLLNAISAVGSTIIPNKGIPVFTAQECGEIVRAVDKLSTVRRILPMALRAAVALGQTGGTTTLEGEFGEISPDLITAVLQEVDVRRVHEIKALS